MTLIAEVEMAVWSPDTKSELFSDGESGPIFFAASVGALVKWSVIRQDGGSFGAVLAAKPNRSSNVLKSLIFSLIVHDELPVLRRMTTKRKWNGPFVILSFVSRAAESVWTSPAPGQAREDGGESADRVPGITGAEPARTPGGGGAPAHPDAVLQSVEPTQHHHTTQVSFKRRPADMLSCISSIMSYALPRYWTELHQWVFLRYVELNYTNYTVMPNAMLNWSKLFLRCVN